MGREDAPIQSLNEPTGKYTKKMTFKILGGMSVMCSIKYSEMCVTSFQEPFQHHQIHIVQGPFSQMIGMISETSICTEHIVWYDDRILYF